MRKPTDVQITELGTAILWVLNDLHTTNPNDCMTLAEIRKRLAAKGWDCTEQQIDNELETLTGKGLLTREEVSRN